MAEEALTTPAVTQGNDQAARTETGEIKDQQGTQSAGSANQETTTEKKVETKPAEGEKKPEAGKEGEKKPDAGKVPDKYEFKAPEGQEVDAKAVEAATPILKELGIDQAGAQKLFDFMAARDQAAAEATNKAYETTRTGWREEISKSDLGDGKADLSADTKKNVATVIESLGDAKAQSAFKDAMNFTGAGDNPAFVRAMNTLGKLLSEGSAVRGGGPAKTGQSAPGATDRPSPAAAMYPNLASSSKS